MTRREALICLLLAGITLGIYWPTHHFDYLNYDDSLLLQDSLEVQAGLTWNSLKWAFTAVVSANWHPVTNLSFLCVSQFFGVAPGPHHLANVIIHSLNAALLFLLLRRLTVSAWGSAMTAAVFAWHPLRVESVAWIIERKDVLCAFFFFLSLLAYIRFAHKNPAKENAALAFRSGNFYLALVFFILALLSKPMAVTLPFVLLLLDFWPLRRMTNDNASATDSAVIKLSISNRQLKTLCLEKLPFFAITGLFCFVTYRVQLNHAAVMTWENMGLDSRVANAISSYVAYPAKFFWPMNLAVIYPLPNDYDLTQVILKAGLLLAISLGCVLQLIQRPWLAFGWFWYLGMAVPIIGLVQVGQQSMADRYTYLPLIGPTMAMVWIAIEIGSKWRRGKVLLVTAAILILSTLAGLTERQLKFWQNTLTVFYHNLAVTPGNSYDFFVLGVGWETAGDNSKAIVCYRVAKKMQPADIQNRQNLIHLLALQGHFDAAANEYSELVVLAPDDFKSHLAYARLLGLQGHMDEYQVQLDACVSLNPDCLEALNNLSWILATDPRPNVRDGVRAVELAEHACQLTQHKNTLFIGTLAAAYAEAGRFDDAVATAQRACDVAQKNGETNLLESNQKLLERYREHKTARE